MRRESWRYQDHLLDNKPIPIKQVQKGFHYEGEVYRGMIGKDLTDLYKLFGRKFLLKGEEFRYPYKTAYSSWSKKFAKADEFSKPPAGGWGVTLSAYVQEKDTYLDLAKKGLYERKYDWTGYDIDESDTNFSDEHEVIVKPGVMATIEFIKYPYANHIIQYFTSNQDTPLEDQRWYNILIKQTLYPEIVRKYILFVVNNANKFH